MGLHKKLEQTHNQVNKKQIEEYYNRKKTK